jgi:methylated-DNA-protein-cysteine methyltransferase related protein
MPKKGSPTFQRIRKALLDLVKDIPFGKVVTVSSLAEALNIPPRHVAFVLSGLIPSEQMLIPWHRVIPTKRDLGNRDNRAQKLEIQLSQLVAEGIKLQDHRLVELNSTSDWQPPNTHRNTFWADAE